MTISAEGAEKSIHTGQAVRWYSWRMPPIRSRPGHPRPCPFANLALQNDDLVAQQKDPGVLPRRVAARQTRCIEEASGEKEHEMETHEGRSSLVGELRRKSMTSVDGLLGTLKCSSSCTAVPSRGSAWRGSRGESANADLVTLAMSIISGVCDALPASTSTGMRLRRCWPGQRSRWCRRDSRL